MAEEGAGEGMEYAAATVASPTPEFTCLIDYYCHNGLYGHVKRLCESEFGRGNDEEAHFWHAVALTAEGAHTQAIQELKPLLHVPEMAPAVNAALIAAHRIAQVPDKESIARLKANLEPLVRAADDVNTLVFAGRYFLHADKEKTAAVCLKKAKTKDPNHVETLALLGWMYMQPAKSWKHPLFNKALELTPQQPDIGALLGRSQFYERCLKMETANAAAGKAAAASARGSPRWERVLDDLNQIIVAWPKFTPALVEKSRVLMLSGHWEESLGTARRVLAKDPRDVSALRLVLLHHLTRSAGSAADATLNELIEALERNEQHNHALMYDISQLVARLCNRRESILKQTLVLVEKACLRDPLNSHYLTEQGYQLMLLNDYTRASMCFQEASKLEQNNIAPLAGLIKCKIMQGNLKEAQEEIELLAEISSSLSGAGGGGGGAGNADNADTANLTYLRALLAWLREGNESKTMRYLNRAMLEHAEALRSIPLGFGYFIAYNPDFVLESAYQYMQHVGTEPMHSTDPPNPVLNECIKLLRELVDMVPGMAAAQILLARTLFIAGRFEESEAVLDTCLRLDAKSGAPVYIIQAQICLVRENFQQCSQSLEQARALDFEIRNTPIYHLMKTKLLEASGQIEDALKVLHAAMELPGVKRAAHAPPTTVAARGTAAASAGSAAALALLALKNVHNPSASLKSIVPLQDRISIFLELATVHAKLNQMPEAQRVMTEARAEFKNTTEVARIQIAEAELACKRRDFDVALKMLQAVPSDSPYATRSKIKMADIYLRHKKNKKAYAACYHELAQQMQSDEIAVAGNSVHGYMLLGEAYLNIQEPEKAIRAYEAALKLNPGDVQLASKIGRALITTHDYAKAVQYYESATNSHAGENPPPPAAPEDGSPAAAPLSASTRIFLLHDLAELYLSLKDFANAVRVVDVALRSSARVQAEAADALGDDVRGPIADVKSLSILADIGAASGDAALVEQKLTEAFQKQKEGVLPKLSASVNPDALRREKDITASLCFRLAEHYRSRHQLDRAQMFYAECLTHNEVHEKARLALARLHLLNNDLDACQAQCAQLMKIDPSNRDGSIMMADLMFRKNEYENATQYFQILLEKNPTRYDALNKLIQLLRRAGRLVDAPKFLKLAEKSSPKATFAAGLHYCKGLYAWYTNDPKTSLSEFNHARKDGEWGRVSLINMIEIYLNPDNQELFASEAVEAKGGDHVAEQVSSAEKLLADLQALADPSLVLRVAVLESYVLMASKNKARVDQALDNLQNLCRSDAARDYVPALLAMSNAFMLRGEPAKARNQLKRIGKLPYDPEFGVEFERAWLMLADTYIDVGKYDQAEKLFKMALDANKSSAKTWEMYGVIKEKEQMYKDAAECYEKAWSFMSESSPSVGYKLAFNYLKANRFLEAIDVCHKVLATHPDYPKIRKDILAKAREKLRP